MSLYTEDDLAALGRPHCQRAWFAEVDLPSGLRRLHTGMGPIEIAGLEWQGVSDPFGGQLIGIGSIEEPEFGQASAVDVVISGANRAFFRQMWVDRHALEGGRCDLYVASFDAESGDVVVPLKRWFPGKLTAPKFSIVGANIRFMSMKIVSPFEGLNFPETRMMWSPAGQRARYPGDEGLDLITSDIIEEYKA